MSCYDLVILSYDVQSVVVLVCRYQYIYLLYTDYMFIALCVPKNVLNC